MRDICKFTDDQPFTVKWVDEEGICSRCVLLSGYSADNSAKIYIIFQCENLSIVSCFEKSGS